MNRVLNVVCLSLLISQTMIAADGAARARATSATSNATSTAPASAASTAKSSPASASIAENITGSPAPISLSAAAVKPAPAGSAVAAAMQPMRGRAKSYAANPTKKGTSEVATEWVTALRGGVACLVSKKEPGHILKRHQHGSTRSIDSGKTWVEVNPSQPRPDASKQVTDKLAEQKRRAAAIAATTAASAAKANEWVAGTYFDKATNKQQPCRRRPSDGVLERDLGKNVLRSTNHGLTWIPMTQAAALKKDLAAAKASDTK